MRSFRDCTEDGIEKKKTKSLSYDKEKYIEMTLDAAQTVLGTFGFDRTVYGDSKNMSIICLMTTMSIDDDAKNT